MKQEGLLQQENQKLKQRLVNKMANEDNSQTREFSDREINLRVRKRSLFSRLKLRLNFSVESALELGKELIPLGESSFKKGQFLGCAWLGGDDYRVKVVGTDLSNDYQKFLQLLTDNGYIIK